MWLTYKKRLKIETGKLKGKRKEAEKKRMGDQAKKRIKQDIEEVEKY